MDTKFSVAVHILILISESPNPLSSDQMAESVGINASYIRKVLALLKKVELLKVTRKLVEKDLLLIMNYSYNKKI